MMAHSHINRGSLGEEPSKLCATSSAMFRNDTVVDQTT